MPGRIGQAAVALLAGRQSVGVAMTDQRSQQVLEFPAISERLAELTAFGPSRRMAEALEPSSDAVVVGRALDQTDEARALSSSRPDVGIGGAHDIGPQIGRARRGGRLDGRRAARDPGDDCRGRARCSDALPHLSAGRCLHELSRQIKPLPQLRAPARDEYRQQRRVAGLASPRWAGLRRAVRIAYERLRTRLRAAGPSEPRCPSALQEPIITLRNGRYVVPCGADAKGKVKGIVHDQSGSGRRCSSSRSWRSSWASAWREAQLAVEAEEERILDELSALVGGNADALAETLEALATFDFWLARARLAGQSRTAQRANDVGPSRSSSLPVGAASRADRAGSCPSTSARAATTARWSSPGPNTGRQDGRPAHARAAALMHQSGPAHSSGGGVALPIFARYSPTSATSSRSPSHCRRSQVTSARSCASSKKAGPGCLVLLDELGAGTDPTEGSALAQALLDYFLQPAHWLPRPRTTPS
jgi:DNA mismatch repair protein MutS2